PVSREPRARAPTAEAHRDASGLAAEELGGGPHDLVARDLADALREAPAVAERIGDLAVTLAPEGVTERLPDLRARVDRAGPERVDLVRDEVKHGRRATDRER